MGLFDPYPHFQCFDLKTTDFQSVVVYLYRFFINFLSKGFIVKKQLFNLTINYRIRVLNLVVLTILVYPVIYQTICKATMGTITVKGIGKIRFADYKAKKPLLHWL